MAAELIEGGQLAGSCRKFLDQVKRIQKEAEAILGLEKKYQQLKALYSEAKEKKDGLLELLNLPVQETERIGFIEELTRLYGEWKPLLADMENKIKSYFEECQGMEAVKKELRGLMEELGGDLPAVFQNIIRECGNSVLNYLEENGIIVRSLLEWKDNIQAGFQLEEQLKNENFEEMVVSVKEQAVNLFQGKAAEEPAAEDWESSEGMSFLKLADSWKEKGVLSLVAENASDKRRIEGEDLPSIFASSYKREETGTDPIRALLFQEYLFSCLDSYCDEGEGYDIEYILGESQSDLENLKAAANQLLLLREGLNLAYLYTDSEKRQEASMLAKAITGAAGLAVLYPVAELLIIGAWAFGESITDVRNLFSGGKEPIWKSPSSWHTSLENLLTSGISDQVQNSEGLDYEIYLRFLLLCRNQVKKRLRAMDVIQWKMQRHSPGFLFSSCIGQADMTFLYEAMPSFWGSTGRYHMKTSSSYGYD